MIIMMYLIILFLLISSILMLLNFLISKNKIIDREKASPFECGFDPLNSSRLPFSIQFYMISLIFLIFDVEIIIFLPMMPSFTDKEWWLTLFSFTWILLMGLFIEWNDGALKWMK
nr:NADH deshydrogenase subunit 3 [Odontocolon albotibiale]